MSAYKRLESAIKVGQETIDKHRARIAELTESNARLQATYDHVEEINLRYAELIQSLQNDRKLADMAWTDNQAALNKQVEEITALKMACIVYHNQIINMQKAEEE